MNCPDMGTLRAALDRPAALQEPPLAEHLADCPDCQATVAALRRSAELAAPAMALLAPPDTPADEEVAAALERIGAQHRVRIHAAAGADVFTRRASPAADVIENGPGAGPSDPPEPGRVRLLSRLPTALRAAAAAVVVAVALGAVVATPTGRGAAADLLAQFRSERLAVVSFDPNGLRRGLWALDSLGTVNEEALFSIEEPLQVASLEEASRRVGFEVRGARPADLPGGVRTEPTIYVVPGRTLSFTFDRERARRFVAERGRPDVKLPAKFDGASIVAEIPAAAVLTYGGTDRVPMVAVGQAGQLKVRTEGDVTLAEMREFLLGLPGLPAETVRQLRSISDWRTTLPVFVPAGEVDWERTTVDGTKALGFSDRSSVASAVVWQRDGRIYGVGGTIDESAVRRVAAGLG